MKMFLSYLENQGSWVHWRRWFLQR